MIINFRSPWNLISRQESYSTGWHTFRVLIWNWLHLLLLLSTCDILMRLLLFASSSPEDLLLSCALKLGAALVAISTTHHIFRVISNIRASTRIRLLIVWIHHIWVELRALNQIILVHDLTISVIVLNILVALSVACKLVLWVLGNIHLWLLGALDVK